MAKVTITFQDSEDGTIHINIDSDEALPLENGKFPEDISGLTDAQQAAVMAMEYILDMVEDIEHFEGIGTPHSHTRH